MPELPEVQTIVNDLNEQVLERTFLDVWTDEKKIIKKSWDLFKKELRGRKIKNVYRKGKNIIFELSGDYSMLTHLKMTGHYLYDNWNKDDKMNSFIHVKFFLDNNKILALSDLRKFAKVELKKTEEIKKDLKRIGPDPFEINLNQFKNRLKNGKIKQVLMNQELVSGIGNIYSDEILWEAKVHPEKKVKELSDKEFEDIYEFSKKVLKTALKARGSSISDYRDLEGKKGYYGDLRKVYRREGEECLRCGSKIIRKMIGQRSAHFCPSCQKL
jgi:formamidopyrimidine-DNA glycosylase